MMYGNVTVSAVLSLTDWPVPFHDTKKREVIENIVFRYKQQNDGLKL